MSQENIDVLDTTDLDNSIEDVSIEALPNEEPDSDEGDGASGEGDVNAHTGAEAGEGEGEGEGEGAEGSAQDSDAATSGQGKKEDEPFLKDGDIVYKTKEAAVRSPQHK